MYKCNLHIILHYVLHDDDNKVTNVLQKKRVIYDKCVSFLCCQIATLVAKCIHFPKKWIHLDASKKYGKKTELFINV